MRGISQTHRRYDEFLSRWKRCRDAFAGSDAVKEAGEVYLPRLPGQDQAAYDAYRMRTVFYGAAGHTLTLYMGLAFSKAPVISGLVANDPLLVDANMAGKPFLEILEDALENVIGMGRYGILVDYAGEIRAGMTKGDAVRERTRPYLAAYGALDITFWHEGRRSGYTVPDHVVLHEFFESEEACEEEQFRELILSAEGYVVRLWRKVKNEDEKEEWTVVSTVRPLLDDAPLDRIPFFFLDPEYGSSEPACPPLLGLVDVNMSHYRTMADLEHGRFFCGLPTPIFAGFSFQEGETVKLGSMRGIASSAPDAKAYYLEFTGAGLSALESAARQKEQWMSQLGGSMLDSEKTGIEAAETIRMKRTGSNATLASMAQAVSAVMTKVLKLMVRWAGGNSEGVSVMLLTEYMPAAITPDELSVLLQAVQSGDFRRVDWLARCKVAGILAQDMDAGEIERELGKTQSYRIPKRETEGERKVA